MKIALVTLYGVINSLGGSTKALCDMANMFSKYGHDVGIFFWDPKDGEIKYEIRPCISVKNCCNANIRKYINYNFVARALSIFSIGRKNRRIKRCRLEAGFKSIDIKREIDGFSPDLIVSFSQFTTYMLIDRIGEKIPVITSLHSDPQAYLSRPEFELFRPCLEKGVAIHVLMPEYAEIVEKYLSVKNVLCIPNAIRQFECAPDLKRMKIVNVARVASVKRQHLLVEAFALLHKRFPDWTLDIWGACNGDYAKYVQNLIDRLKLSSVVQLNGETDNVKDVLKQSSIFAFPSQREGFSIALGEAMSMGLPTVGCKDCPSVNSIIKDGVNGFLSDNTPEGIALALEKLMVSYSLRCKLGGQAKSDMKKFSEAEIWKQWNMVFDKIS